MVLDKAWFLTILVVGMSARAVGEPNKGSAALVALCPGYGDQKRIAASVGADEAQFSRWLRGLRKPEPKMRGVIQERLGISWSAWDEPAAPDATSVASEPTKEAS